jgi:hypothetical protein
MIDNTASVHNSQVGGHSCLLSTCTGHLLKPTDQSAEVRFYCSPPSSLVGSIPMCYAVHPFTKETQKRISTLIADTICSEQGRDMEWLREIGEDNSRHSYVGKE